MLSMVISIILLVAFSLTAHHYQKSYHFRKLEEEKEERNFNSAKECLSYFHVEVPEGHVIFHLNGDKKDNRFNNLDVIPRKLMLKIIGGIKK